MNPPTQNMRLIVLTGSKNSIDILVQLMVKILFKGKVS